MPLRISDEENEKKLNPGQVDADRKFDVLKKAERNGNFQDNEIKDTSDIKKSEEDTKSTNATDWVNNVSGNGSKNKSKSSGLLKFAKKKGPLTLIISLVIGGGFGISTLFSPGLLLVQIKEMMVNKFNTQLTSMDVRTSKMLTKKMGTTSGLCGSVITIKCKYSTLSEKQLNNFKRAGIEVNIDEKATLLGRKKPTSFVYEGKTINASEFTSELSKNPKFRSAIKLAYNPKLSGFSDSIWKFASKRLGISKRAVPIEGETDEARLKSIQEDVSSGETKLQKVSEGEINPETNKNYTAEEVDAINSAVDDAEKIASKEVKVSTELLNDVESSASFNMGKVANVLKLTGALDGACEVYKGVRAVGFAAKTVRAVQLARYAMIFLNVADQIKAGVAKPEDVSYLGGILTSTSKNGKSATDSFGYRYAAFGDSGKMSTTATQYLAGGGMSGKLINVTSLVNSKLGGKPRKTCDFLGNPFVSIGSLLVGVGLFLIPGVNVAIGLKDVAQAGAGVLFGLASAILPALLKDIVAGVLVDKNTIGEAAGDAITSGASGMMGSVAKAGGNAPLTPEQAVAYNTLSNNVLAQYAEEDRLSYSPFDISNSNTFMGSIVSKLTPYIYNMSSISGVIKSVASLSMNSFSFLSPQSTKATSIDDYTMCQDYDYKDIKGDGSNVRVATDPYCNIVYGIPVENLETDPITLATTMIDTKQVDETTGQPIPDSKYSDFIDNCINRKNPLGDTADSEDGSECILNSSTDPDYKNYYLYYIDQRVENGMEDY